MNTNVKNDSREIYFVLLTVGILLAKRLMISPYGINREAGGEFELALSILNGKLIYRDVFWYHGFLPIYLNALLFKLFSPQIYLVRINETVCALLGVFFAYKAARYVLSPALASIASLLAFSGMTTPIHASGQFQAIVVEIISLYYLLKYLDTGRQTHLFLSGVFGGLVFLIQIFPIGIVTLFGGVLAILCFAIFDSPRHLQGLKPFFYGLLPFPLAGYGIFAALVPLETLYVDLFPMFTGHDISTKVYSTLPIPELLPGIHFNSAPAEIVAVLNRYIFNDLRWWLIILVFLWGLMEFIAAMRNGGADKTRRLMLGTLTLFGPLFEIKFLLTLGRLGAITPSLLNMLPTWILLFYLLSFRLKSKLAIAGLGTALFLVYFIYPFGKYYLYFARNAVPLDLPYTAGIKVSPYRRDLYRNVCGYIDQRTKTGDLILTMDINRYYSLLCERADVFSENYQTAIVVSFYPLYAYTGALSEPGRTFREEAEIAVRARNSAARFILVPKEYREHAPFRDSPFLAYLGNNWEKAATFGDPALANPYDWESPMEIYAPKPGAALISAAPPRNPGIMGGQHP